MADCEKCKTGYANASGFCDNCQKGVDKSLLFGSGLPSNQTFTIKEYIDQLTSNHSEIHSIMHADDVLLEYEYHESYQHFELPLRKDGQHESEYEKLEEWFDDRFFILLRDRISSVSNIRFTDDQFSKIKDDFFLFKMSIRNLITDSFGNSLYHGIADIHLTDLAIKKVLMILDVQTKVADDAATFLEEGSALYFLELFSRLRDFQVIDRLQNFFIGLQHIEFARFVFKPMLMLKPWDHQKKAFDNWLFRERKGIIVMATATGKTLVGLLAIMHCNDTLKKGKVLIIAHSKAILNQWRKEIIDKLGLHISDKEDYRTSVKCGFLDIIFQTFQTVYKDPNKYRADLMIADEVHHGAGVKFRKALTVPCTFKMGLSATIDGKEKYDVLKEYLGKKVYEYSLDQARDDDIIPEFKWILHTTYLTQKEETEFRLISKQIRTLFNSIRNDRNTILKIDPQAKDIEINSLYDIIKLFTKARYKDIKLPKRWRNLQQLLFQRRWIIHRSFPKQQEAVDLAAEYAEHKKVILFCMDIETCEAIGNQLRDRGKPVYMTHSQQKEELTEANLDSFKDASHGVLIGARMLDEGINIADAEIGINVSSSKTRLQLVQRMGRVLRKLEGKKPIFHHFIAVPEKESYISEEDNIKFIDDLNWVQDTALRMGVTTEMSEGIQTLKNLKLNVEKDIIDRYNRNQELKIPKYGVFNVDNVLGLYSKEARKKMINLLNEHSCKSIISDSEWTTLTQQAHKSLSEPLNIPGYWWLLVACERDPKKLRELFKKYQEE